MVFVAGLDEGESELYSELCVARCQRDRAQKECENLHKRLNQFKDLCHRQHEALIEAYGELLAIDYTEKSEGMTHRKPIESALTAYNQLKKEMEQP